MAAGTTDRHNLLRMSARCVNLCGMGLGKLAIYGGMAAYGAATMRDVDRTDLQHVREIVAGVAGDEFGVDVVIDELQSSADGGTTIVITDRRALNQRMMPSAYAPWFQKCEMQRLAVSEGLDAAGYSGESWFASTVCTVRWKNRDWVKHRKEAKATTGGSGSRAAARPAGGAPPVDVSKGDVGVVATATSHGANVAVSMLNSAYPFIPLDRRKEIVAELQSRRPAELGRLTDAAASQMVERLRAYGFEAEKASP